MHRFRPALRQILLCSTVILLFSLYSSASAKDFDDAVSGHIAHPGWFTESPFNDLEGLLVEARAEEKIGLMVLFTTQGCSYCEQFIRKSLGDTQIAERVRTNFVTVGFEIFDDREMIAPLGQSLPIKTFAKQEGAGFSPTLLFYDEGGKRVARQVGYLSPERFSRILDFLIDGHSENISLRDYLRQTTQRDAGKQASPGLNEDPLFMRPPFALDRSRFRAEQPLLVIFEKTDCHACDTFHRKVLGRTEVRELLMGFDIVRLDVEDTHTPVVGPDGTPTTPAEWWSATPFARLPALMFFEENGRQVLQTDALVGRQRMLNSVNYVLHRAYERDWTYQRFARTTAIEKLNQQKD